MIPAAILVAILSATTPATATVYEYSRDGRVIVRQSSDIATQQAQPWRQAARAAPVAASRAVYRDMAEQVALRHAGGTGPRRAGLDAITFSRIFVELIRAESGFNPRALSPKGAQGLGQLMPDTARLLGVRDAWNPAQNLDGAARYFTAQLERFGDVSLALAAYNAGPHRIVEYGGVPPFRETRAYVARITAASGQRPAASPAPPPPAGLQAPVLSTSNSPKDISVWQY